MTNIGTFIRNLRKERGISQKDLAYISGVSMAVVSRIENGDMKVNVQSLNKILKVFGYQVGGNKIFVQEDKDPATEDYDYYED